ncbi:MAG: LysM peptidoglycan-binding domain-containing protein, partial [Anaerolineales bacterium]
MILSKKTLIFTLILTAFSLTIQARMFLADSVGTRTINQKLYIVHKVEKGETLYALSRKYKVDVQSLIDANPGSQNGINIGQELIVPTGLSTGVVGKEDKNIKKQSATQGEIVHRVTSGETLYIIGQKYGVNVNEIKRWNNLRGNTISVGQQLTIYLSAEKANEINKQKEVMETNGKKIHIVSQGETLFSIAKMYN